MRLRMSSPYQAGALCLLIAALWGSLPKAQADTANLNLKLTIVTPPQCTIKGGTAMSVNFGDVRQESIDGNYKKTLIDYGLVCTSVASSLLKMTLGWTNATLGGGDSIQTNRTNLGIAVYRDSTRLSNNASLNFTNGSPPALYAVPVKPSGVMLTDGGSFSGYMTLTLDYQ
ncbi:TPA: fimbrial protein [Serratia fonticola]|uniref:fimbrial protein n=1 Tax=Serratia fonticola TaxID=47917 RepID=UPI002177056E|nr:fimbrial protein [Serratia fonticola]CAI1221618.1 putative minor fimbrial subunit StfE [Serratia fonticola]CAI2497275.1 putative minor fimbrial subunit StfE [Serratia fonticola]